MYVNASTASEGRKAEDEVAVAFPAAAALASEMSESKILPARTGELRLQAVQKSRQHPASASFFHCFLVAASRKAELRGEEAEARSAAETEGEEEVEGADDDVEAMIRRRSPSSSSSSCSALPFTSVVASAEADEEEEGENAATVESLLLRSSSLVERSGGGGGSEETGDLMPTPTTKASGQGRADGADVGRLLLRRLSSHAAAPASERERDIVAFIIDVGRYPQSAERRAFPA